MRFACDCGHVIRDQTDYLPHKASLLRDEDDERFWDAIDNPLADFVAAIRAGRRDAWVADHLGPDYGDDDARVIHTILLRPWLRYSVHAYECEVCDRLHVERDRGGDASRFVTYAPQSGRVERVLASQFGSPRPTQSGPDAPAG